MLNNVQDYKKFQQTHQCTGCPHLEDGICMDVTAYIGEPVEADNVLSCGIRDELWTRKEVIENGEKT
jgi:hypothetical protein